MQEFEGVYHLPEHQDVDGRMRMLEGSRDNEQS